jgi:uncharacterized Zn finger protein (UPF0148 family)
MDAAKCDQCGVAFFPEATGWTACADCLAAEIELALLGELRLGARKPMRRAIVVSSDEKVAEGMEAPSRKIA